MREPVGGVGRELDEIEHLGDARGAAGCEIPRCAIPSDTIASHLHPRVERAVRVLEDDLRLAAGSRAARPSTRAARPCPSKRTLPSIGSDQPQDQARERALAAAALADQRQRLAGADVEVDTVHGRQRSSSGARRSPARPGTASSGPGPRAVAHRGVQRTRRGVVAAELIGLRRASRARVLLDASVDAVRAARREPAGRRHGRQLRHAAEDDREALARHRPGRACCASAPGCRGAGDRRTPRRTVSASTISPAYITATRSAISLTTPRLCVIRITLIPSSSRRPAIRSRIWAWIVTSSAVVGSSAISSLGSSRSASRDHHALAHPAGELVRVVVEPRRRARDADALEHLDRAGPRLASSSAAPCARIASVDLAADRERRVERASSAPGRPSTMSLPRTPRISRSREREQVPPRAARALPGPRPPAAAGASGRARSSSCRSRSRRPDP